MDILNLMVVLLSAVMGLATSFLSSILFQAILIRKSNWVGRNYLRAIRSLDDKLIFSRSRRLEDDEMDRLRAELMVYIMNAHSSEKAERYIEAIVSRMGEEGKVLKEHSHKILRERLQEQKASQKETGILVR